MPFIARVQNKNVLEIISREKFIKSMLEKGNEIVAYQKSFQTEAMDENLLVEIKI